MKFREGKRSIEKEVTNHEDDFSIPKCIEVLNKMEGLSIEEKVVAVDQYSRLGEKSDWEFGARIVDSEQILARAMRQ